MCRRVRITNSHAMCRGGVDIRGSVMQIRPIHPFPARMAPDLALDALVKLPKGSVVLDPMAGSGTVLRQAVNLSHHAIGFDLDPLAVLMARVWTAGADAGEVQEEYDRLIKDAVQIDLRSQKLPWVVGDDETAEFVSYWFGAEQRRALKKLSLALYRRRHSRGSNRRHSALDVLAIALSRIIITKDQGASLARDASHSRPHKVGERSDYDVFSGFDRSVAQLKARIQQMVRGRADVRLGDSRDLPLANSSVDAILTSPPYLNAIDYMRGHRLSLVWLGYGVKELRSIRGASIGAERAGRATNPRTSRIVDAILGKRVLSDRFRSIVRRYADDLNSMAAEASRVLKKGGTATFVVGNSCLRDVFVRNACGMQVAGELAGLKIARVVERELPQSSRYLPITSSGALSKRMRTETVISFEKVKD